MLERLDVWLAIFALGALAYSELRLGRFVVPFVRGVMSVARPAAQEAKRRLPTMARLHSRPIRGDAGRFNGSLPAVPDAEHRSADRSASERAGTIGTEFPIGTIPPAEIALIGLLLGRGMSASDVAKSLPGYSARKYKEYREKVLKIEAELAELEPVEEPQEVA